MYKVIINGKDEGIYKEDNMQEIAEKFVEAVNKAGEPSDKNNKVVLKIYVEKVDENEY